MFPPDSVPTREFYHNRTESDQRDLDRVTGFAIRLWANDEERAQLRTKLTAMRVSKTTVARPIEFTLPVLAPPPLAPVVVDDEDAQATRRLSPVYLFRMSG